jgi:hypothetical protein
MIHTVQIGQPTIYTTDEHAVRIRKSSEKPRVTFLWDGQKQQLQVNVPQDFSAEYVNGFKNANALHVIMSKDAWFRPVPKQMYTLGISDKHSEPLLLGFTEYDWINGNTPEITAECCKAKANIVLPDGRQRTVTLLVGGRG